MKIQAALVREQGVTFSVVVVKSHVVADRLQANAAIRSLQPLFPQVPIVLMAQDARDVPTYYGRQDIVRFLSGIRFQALPWREYSVG